MASNTRLRIVKSKNEETLLWWVNNLKVGRDAMKIEIKGGIDQRKDGSFALCFILPEDFVGEFPLLIEID